MSTIINWIAITISMGAFLVFILIIPIFSNRLKIKTELKKSGFEDFQIHFPARGLFDQSPKSGVNEAAFFIFRKHWGKVSSHSTIRYLKFNRVLELIFYASFILIIAGILSLVAIEFL